MTGPPGRRPPDIVAHPDGFLTGLFGDDGNALLDVGDIGALPDGPSADAWQARLQTEIDRAERALEGVTPERVMRDDQRIALAAARAQIATAYALVEIGVRLEHLTDEAHTAAPATAAPEPAADRVDDHTPWIATRRPVIALLVLVVVLAVLAATLGYALSEVVRG